MSSPHRNLFSVGFSYFRKGGAVVNPHNQRPDFNLYGLSLFLSSVGKSLARFDYTDPEYRNPKSFLVLLDAEIIEQETEQELSPEENHTLRLLQSVLVDTVHLQISRLQDTRVSGTDWQRLASSQERWFPEVDWLLPDDK